VPRLLVDVTPLRANRDFRFLFSGQLVSLLGSNLTIVAVPYQIYRETHSSLWVGLASLIQLPFLIAGSLWGGALGDRADKRKLLIIGTFVLALASGGLALNAHQPHSHFVALVLLAALAAGFAGFTGPIRAAAIPKLVRPDELLAAYSLNQIIVNSAAVVGPSLAGVLLASFGLFWCYLFDAATFFVLMAATGFMSPMKPTGDHAGVALLRSIGEGFQYVRTHAVAQAVYLVDLNAMVFGLPRALFPAMALTVYHAGPRTLGLLYAAPGAGALVMAVLTGWIVRVRRQGRLVALVVIAWGAAMAFFGLVHVVWIGLACLAVAGAADVISTVLRNTILQTAISDEFRGRISSIQMAVVTGGPRLGDAESGLVASLTSTEISIVSGGIACVVGVLALVRWRPDFWRREAI
jgi:MFS family permease